MNTSEFLNKLPSAVVADAVDGMDCTVQLNLSSPTYLSVRDGGVSIHAGTHEAPDVSLTASDEDMVSILTGKLDGVSAYMAGKLTLDGDLMLAKQVATFFDSAKLA